MTLTTDSYLTLRSALMTTAELAERSLRVCSRLTVVASSSSLTVTVLSGVLSSSESSLPTMTWMIRSGCLGALPTLGKSIMLGAISGAVTMKMIRSTSITSMKGTMLISLMVRRPRPRLTSVGMANPLQWPEADCVPTLRCRMLENSSMKVSSVMATRSMSRANRL